MKKKRINQIILSIFAGLLIASCQAIKPQTETEEPIIVQQNGLIAEGIFEPFPSAELAFGIPGIVSEMYVSEGDIVNMGVPIARLDECGTIETELSSTQTNLLVAQQDLADLEQYAQTERANALQALIDAQEVFDEAQLDWDDFDEDAYQDDLGEAQEDLQEVQEDLDDALADLEEYLDLEQDNPTRERYQDAVEDAQRDLHVEQQDLNEIKNGYQQAKQEFDLAAGQLEIAQAEYDAKKDGADVDQRAKLESRITTLETALTGLGEQIKTCQITAPLDGMLVHMDLQIGEFLSAGDPRVMVANRSQWKLKTDDISEFEVVNIQEGQQVEVTADALPGIMMDGVVEKIDQVATLDHGDVTYTVTISVENSPPELYWGMTAAIRFIPIE